MRDLKPTVMLLTCGSSFHLLSLSHDFYGRNNLNVRTVVLCINGCMEFCVVHVKYAPKWVCVMLYASKMLCFELTKLTEPSLFTGVLFEGMIPTSIDHD